MKGVYSENLIYRLCHYSTQLDVAVGLEQGNYRGTCYTKAPLLLHSIAIFS